MRASVVGAAGLVLVLCLLGFGQGCPTVAVVILESATIPRSSAFRGAEDAIRESLVSYGFGVVDLVHVRGLRATQAGLAGVQVLAQRALAGDPVAVRQLAARNGGAADILVVGEAVATVTVFEALLIPRQPRIQDGRSRIEVRAIEVATGRVLAAEAESTGGIDFGPSLAAEKALERAGKTIACRVAQAVAREYPYPLQCLRRREVCTPPEPTFAVLPFRVDAPGASRGLGIEELLPTATELALSQRGCGTAQLLDADYVVEAKIAHWRTGVEPAVDLPLLRMILRRVTVDVTVDVRVLDVPAAEFQGFEVTANVSGNEILGLRFGVSRRAIARAVADQIAAQVGLRCGRR